MIITGTPGEVWLNDTPYVHWQRFSSLINVCGYCLAEHGLISDTPWSLPSHDRCRCSQIPVPPGEAAESFIDRRQVLSAMDEEQRRRAIGTSNWLLFRNKVVSWNDIVGPERIRTLADVVRMAKLTVKDMVAVGMAAYIAEQAWMTVHQPERVKRKAVAAKQDTQWGKELTVADPEFDDESPQDAIKSGLAVLARLGRTPDMEVPDFGGSVAAMRGWVARMFPGAVLSDEDWALLIILVEEQARYKRMFAKLKIDQAKGMRALHDGG